MTACTTEVFDRSQRAMGELSTNAQLSAIVPLLMVSPVFAESLRTISELARLPDNWDSYGSPKVQPAAVQRAIEVLAAAQAESVPAPRIVPVAGGGLQIEWDAGPRELEIEVLPGGGIEVLMVEGETMNEAPLPVDRINPLVPMLLAWLTAVNSYAAEIR